jgi:DNA-binding MarR family transcriptional regulator
MPSLDRAEQAQQLRTLAADFEALHARVRDVSYTPGTDALRQISPLLLKAQDLTATALVRLGALDSSAYTSIAGSRASLECLSSVVVASSLAGNDLASALYANPYEGAPFPGYPADDASVRTARHAEAIPKMTGHLADAAHQLDLSGIGCHYVATGITRDLAAARDGADTAQRAAGPVLTSAQYDALTALALSGGRLYESSQRGLGVTRVAADDGTRISIATFRALNKRGLVDWDTSTSLFHGQKITVTEHGQQALAKQRPAATAATPAKAVPRTRAVQGARR